MNFKNKRGFSIDILGWLILGVIALIIVVIGIIILKGKGEAALKFIQDLFRYKGK